jgi:hypothetical protein
MDPKTGDVYRLREQLLGEQIEAGLGRELDMQRLRTEIAKLGADATAEEAAAIRAEKLVLVSEQAARKLQLGERELERRRRRRRAEKAARKRNR